MDRTEPMVASVPTHVNTIDTEDMPHQAGRERLGPRAMRKRMGGMMKDVGAAGEGRR